MNDLSTYIELSSDELQTEKELYEKLAFIENENIKKVNPVSFTFLTERQEIYRALTDLKVYLNAPLGMRGCRNSTELANALLSKSKNIENLEHENCSQFIEYCRKTQNKNKDLIEDLIIKALKKELDKKFPDIANTIKFWECIKLKVLKLKGREFKATWMECLKDFPELSKHNNYFLNLINQLYDLELQIIQIDNSRTVENKLMYMKEHCLRVISSEDDNDVFSEIFIMGKLSVVLERLPRDIKQIKKDLESYIEEKERNESRTKWIYELSLNLYLDYWIYGKCPDAYTVIKKYPLLVKNKSGRTVSNQIIEQRKVFSEIDVRVPQVEKGRNPKI
ncbi:hypothetical protein [Psychromonas aquatilis]|uniref:Uncharacterized protein n=1 Tax=Psychromonas aquatilis TaxID=2005072 RepID=A0ABU9GSV4_9GAMM